MAPMQTRLTRFLWTLLAAIFLIEAWLWDVFGGAVKAIVAALPIAALRRLMQKLIDTMPAGFALALFIIPILVVLPFKIAGLALIAGGRVLSGGCVFLAAKTIGLGVTAFVFDVCHARLMTLPWFARFYALVISFRDWAHTKVDPYKTAIRERVAELRAGLRARFSSHAPSLMRKLAAFRARVHARGREVL
ncbi:MAG TPA: hypothetical protein PKA55_15960 [Rhodoblastus sp.]|nr:hypothetical protein [Rhodoblastus sp.]